MIKNLFSNLPFLSKADDELSPEELEIEAKKERIEFHRDHVRNGPTSFRHVTNGMVRRAKARDLQRQMKKTRREQLRTYFRNQQLAAVTRGHLQAAGLLPYAVEREVDLQKQSESVAWLLQNYTHGLATRFTRDDVIAGLSRALKVYGDIVGLPGLQVPADYVVPVYDREATA